MSTYQVKISDGRDGHEHTSFKAARAEVAKMMGWEKCYVSDEFAVDDACDGVECYETIRARNACPDGDVHAPRIIMRRAAQ